MDTKYKITDTPTSDDVGQIVAYAVARGARAAVLIYPRRLSHPFRAEVLTRSRSGIGQDLQSVIVPLDKPSCFS
jgi:hypothetical protein